ncbi:MAG: nif-specific transcriptional activator NifA [Nitrospinae bacterium]|nr:nif-specific transcriptional activator NifA [Nitrospinota bacterium]
MNADLSNAAVNAVFRASVSISKSLGPVETVAEILAASGGALGYMHGFAALVDPDSGDLLVEAAHEIPGEKWKDARYRKGEGITGLILETGEPLAVPRVGSDPRFLHKMAVYEPDSAFVGVPIKGVGGIKGVLTFSLNISERYRLDDHVKIVTMFANLIGGVATRHIAAEKEKELIIREKERLSGQLKSQFHPENMVGISKVMMDVFENVRQVAKWNTTVLVRGESGTGKELVAKAIHYASPRAAGPFIKLNCAAIPDTLLESELFGYEKGAFTGAITSKPGRFELAHKGTLFLDEIGDTSPAFQSKLLRVLQEGQFERLGGSLTITVDVRLITATNMNLEKAVSEKRFREDLYYRLNVMPIYIPPLRERREDIPHLVEHFLGKLGRECGARISMDQEALAVLTDCGWRGNVRELENCVQRSAVRCEGSVIGKKDISCASGRCASRLAGPNEIPGPPDREEDILGIKDERERIIATLRKTGWVQAKAARLLNMTPRQIGYRILKLNIEMKSY